MENTRRKRIENGISTTQNTNELRYTSPNQPTFAPQYGYYSHPNTIPKITFGPLTTINEEESSLY
jgi:hypothetical protein